MRRPVPNMLFVFTALLILAVSGAAQAEKRLALVIGNGAYEVGPLDNPPNDAALMAKTLGEAGFDVTYEENLGYRDLQRAVVNFGRALSAAGTDTVGMIFYAGHAVQAGGENYLIPVDADVQDELDLRIATLDVSTLMASLEQAGNRMNIVVLDACRNNPFKAMSRSVTGGLAKIDAATGTLLAFSTAPGEVASDGSGRNSPYTLALVKAIRTPGLTVEQVFKRVRVDVLEKTAQRQVPWESSSLTGEFVFNKQPVTPPAAPPPAAAKTDPAANQAAEIEFWKAVSLSTDPAQIQAYLNAYPDGLFADLAEQKMAALKASQQQSETKQHQADAKAAWEAVRESSDPALLQRVAEQYGDTVYGELAQVKLQSLNKSATAPDPAPAPAPPPPPPAQQLAALPPPDSAHPYDGEWILTVKVTIPHTQANWCRWGEEVSARVALQDGKMEGRAKSSFTISGKLRLSISDAGVLTFYAKPSGWSSRDVYGRIPKSGDGYAGEIVTHMGNGRCGHEISLRRPG